jgi:hypothetical protein
MFSQYPSLLNFRHIFGQRFLAAALAKFRCPAIGVPGDPLATARVSPFSSKFVMPLLVWLTPATPSPLTSFRARVLSAA